MKKEHYYFDMSQETYDFIIKKGILRESKKEKTILDLCLKGESINKILEEGLNTNNLDHLYKLAKINHIAKEDENMNYGNYNGYGNYGRDEYGTYDGYGARRRDSRGRYMESGYDRRYRGHDDLDRMYENYGRYMESRERYGANEDTKKSLKYMLESMEDFARKLREEASSQEEIQMIRSTAQRIAQM